MIAPKPPAIVRLWIFRALVPLGGVRGLVDWEEFVSRQLAAAVGIEQRRVEGASIPDIRQSLAKLHDRLERRVDRIGMPAQLARNLAMLGKSIGLSEIERRLIGFAVLLHSEPSLEEAVNLLGPLSSIRFIRYLSVLLGLSDRVVRDALAAKGTLSKSALLSVDRSRPAMMRMKLELLSPDFAESILTSQSNPIDLLGGSVHLAEKPQLMSDNYTHVIKSLTIARSYLRHSLKARRQGVNILVYGPPGAGKSQFSRVLAADLKCDLYDVSSEDEEGDGIGGERRLHAYRAAQRILSNAQALMVFDEAEDVFTELNNPFNLKENSKSRKGWMNRALETNPVPTIWVSNSCRCIDPAFIRRFDVVVEMPVPPRGHRAAIARQVCGGTVSDRTIKILSDRSDLSPAIVARAATVVDKVNGELADQSPDEMFCHLIEGVLKAQGKGGSLSTPRVPEVPVYDPSFINADTNAREIIKNLNGGCGARVCLYGPPGTGKTAFGHWIAEQLDVPLHLRRASDLMSMWLGENEKNIAKAFTEANSDKALLLIDEIDSFLPDRRGSKYGWDVRLVNEMLTQMEYFEGVFIATTNRLDILDQASLRRFDLKLEFGYLTTEQSLALLAAYCRLQGLDEPSRIGKLRLLRLQNLTPGDYGAVARRSRFSPLATGDAWIEALEAECALKEGTQAKMGFCR